MNKKGYADIIVGLQFGDEGKGRIVAELSKQYDYVVRYQGGANSGHTIYHNGEKKVLRIMPSTFDAIPVLGSGVVIDPITLVKEIDDLKSVPVMDLRCHITHPIYKVYDILNEGRGIVGNASAKVGSTCRGNTATYATKIMRMGITLADIGADQALSDKFFNIERYYLQMMNVSMNDVKNLELYGEGKTYEEYVSDWWNAISVLGRYKSEIIDTYVMLNHMIGTFGKKVLIEGAQGVMLDIDAGTYPNVTSSNCTALGAFVGTGIAPTHLRKVMGIMKPYVTRVGTGIFPSENDGVLGEALCEIGHEYGSVTGRKRRIGLMDIPMLRYAILINGITDIFVTKLDVAVEASIINNGNFLYVSSYLEPTGGSTDVYSLDRSCNNVSNNLMITPTIHGILSEIATKLDCKIAGYTDSPSGELKHYKA